MGKPHVIGSIDKGDRDALRVALDQHAGKTRLDVRWTSKAGAAAVFMPTREGFYLDVAKIPALRRLICEAEAEARVRGLLLCGGAGD